MTIRPLFSKDVIQAQRRVTAPRTRRASAKKLGCETCGLYKNGCKSPKMDWNGYGEKNALIIAEAPGENEDDEGVQLVGKAGNILRRGLAKHNLNLFTDFWRTNAVNCWPGKDTDGKNKTPTSPQIDCCREVKIKPQLAELKPDFVILMGNAAIDSYYGERGVMRELKVEHLRGRIIPDHVNKCWVMVTYHPSFLSYNENDDNLAALFDYDLEKLAKRLKWGPPEYVDPRDHIECIVSFDRVVELLKGILADRAKIPFLVVDFETSGLKPHAKGHRIHSVCLAFQGKSYSFPFEYPGHFDHGQIETIADLLADTMESSIPKVAHNLKFEDMWTKWILRAAPKNWAWCTMTAEHVHDNTRLITQLKRQAWLRYGIENYDAEFEKYKEGVLTQQEVEYNRQHRSKKKPSSYHHNRVHEMPLDKLLLYGGHDGLVEMWLYEDQQDEIPRGSKLREAYDLFHEALIDSLTDIQDTGIAIDNGWYDREETRLLDEVTDLERKLFNSREAKLFAQAHGRQISLNSDQDLRKLFYEILAIHPPKTTARGAASVDAESMALLELPFAKRLVERKKKLKIVHTYIDGIRRETVDGRCHPIINLHIPVTYRSSCDSPNFQNIPKHEDESKKAVRSGIIASRGNKLLELDFGGIEVRGLAWYSKDGALLDYLHNPANDMHRDQAQITFNISPEMWKGLDKDATKSLRQIAKNFWVFPLFYGSYYKNCAKNIWDKGADLPIGDGQGTTVRQHLGMGYDLYVDYLKKCEKRFWDRFNGVRQWQDSVAAEYQRKGYIETYMGFRFSGFLSRNDLYNYKIQGTAFHLLLWSLIQANRDIKSRGLHSKIIMQIHDSMVLDLVPEEQKEVVTLVRDIMVRRTREQFPWINTPLEAEPEITGINGSFYDLKKWDADDEEGYQAAT